MRWLWFVGSLLCFVVVFQTTSVGLALLCVLGALVFMVVGTLAVAAQRIESSRGDAGRVFGPEEIRRMREAEAKRQAAQAPNADIQAAPIIGVATAAALIAAESAAMPDAGSAETGGFDDSDGFDGTDGGAQ